MGVDKLVDIGVYAVYFFLRKPAYLRGKRMPPENEKRRSKAETLKEGGTLNPTPEAVKDPKFREGEFFDPLDLVQVKYEMLRRVRIEKASIADTSEEYGVCRPTYYQAKSNFEAGGIGGLVPKKRGPRGPHKLQSSVLEFLERHVAPGQPIRAHELAALLKQEFKFEVHPRTIERALRGKKTPR